MIRKLIAMLMALSMLTACGGQSTASDGTTTDVSSGASDEKAVEITYYCQPGKVESNTKIIEAFENENPNIHVTLVELSADGDERLQTMSTVLQAKDTSMDVFEVDCTWPEMFYSAGWLANLDDVVTDEELSEFFAGSVEAGSFEGSQYTLPMYIDTGCLFYRKDIMEKYGYEIPETWDGWIALAQEVMEKEPEITSGFTSAWKQYEALVCCAMEFIWAAGGDVLNEQGEVVLNTPETIAGIQMMYDMMYKYEITDPGIMSYNWAGSRAPFYSGSVFFTRDWPVVVEGANDESQSKVVDKVGFCPLPVGEGGVNYNTTGGWHVGVSAFSAHPAEAKLFAKYLASYDAQKIRAMEHNLLPSRPAIYEDSEVLDKYPYFTELKTVGENTKGRPKSAYYSEVSGVLQQGIGSVLNNMMDVPTAVAQMEEQLNEIVSRG